MIKITHDGITYECAVAVRCENDKYIKLYDSNGVETAAFHNISDFSDYSISGGSFTYPGNCDHPIALTTYSIGSRTITPADWIISSQGGYYYQIENDLISGNEATCNILLLFAEGTVFEYEATQADGILTLRTNTNVSNLGNIIIESIQVTRAR